MKEDLGLVQVYTGDGKGKTTASLGLAFRAAGHGFNVLMVQFMKGCNFLGELEAAKSAPNLEIIQFGKPCTYSELFKSGRQNSCGNCRDCFMSRDEEEEKAKEALTYAGRAAKSSIYDIVILDEVNVALANKLVSSKDVISLIKGKHKSTELILTGFGAPKEIINVADLVTEMKKIKHPFVKGTYGRRGIEY
ncbi:MAG: cob(I)yrinic acid a,c-diamide adenosyltransferase [Candidatus Altiarchaeota archaeon]